MIILIIGSIGIKRQEKHVVFLPNMRLNNRINDYKEFFFCNS